MLASPPVLRLFVLVAVSVAIAILAGVARRNTGWERLAAIVLIALAVVAIGPLCGFPLRWVLRLEIARTVNGIDAGLARLPGITVPYGFGHGEDFTRPVILLGAALLLVCGALTLAPGEDGVGSPRLAAAALPLLVLAVVPSTLATPRLPFVHGAILFVLLAALLFSERVPSGRTGLACSAVVLAMVGAMVVAPSFHRHPPWLRVSGIAGTVGPARTAEAFDWSQTYGPLVWPHDGAVVFEVEAARPAHWKTEDLDLFDGVGWAQAPSGGDERSAELTIPTANVERWTQTVTIAVRGMVSPNVVSAGYSGAPTFVGVQRSPVAGVESGEAPGTWVATPPLAPGDVYEIRAYTPDPTVSQLSGAGDRYPLTDLFPELQIVTPATGAIHSVLAHLPPQPIEFAPFGSRERTIGYADLTSAQALALVKHSVYGPVFALASRLRRGTTTPYAYVEAVMRYLSRGFIYDLSPPAGRYPIVTFLLKSRRGYCQQFAGAMALMLRMEGIPARVAVGFATGTRLPARPGTRSPGTPEYVVSDRDAHAWVEAWFPGYGWVTFDPTPPGSAPSALPTGLRASALGLTSHGHGTTPSASTAASGGAATAGRRPGTRASGGSLPIAEIGAVLVLLAAFTGLWRVARRERMRPDDALLAELERAFAICGRPLEDGLTLVEVERRIGSDPEAARYVEAIRLARYGRVAPAVPLAGRRALRRQLRAGLGLSGALRALVALPPRIGARPTGRGLH